MTVIYISKFANDYAELRQLKPRPSSTDPATPVVNLYYLNFYSYNFFTT